jgi:tetratricopeptide (TPR) repeat protein
MLNRSVHHLNAIMNPHTKEKIVSTVKQMLYLGGTTAIDYTNGLDVLNHFETVANNITARDVLPYIMQARAMFALANGDPARAEQLYAQAAAEHQIHEDNAQAVLALVNAAQVMRLWDKLSAAALYLADAQQIIQTSPELRNAEAEITMVAVHEGLFSAKRGNHTQALHQLRRAIIDHYSTAPIYVTAAVYSWTGQAILHAAQGDTKAAWRVWSLAQQQLSTSELASWHVAVWFSAAVINHLHPASSPHPHHVMQRKLNAALHLIVPGVAFWLIAEIVQTWYQLGATEHVRTCLTHCARITERLPTPALQEFNIRLHDRLG